MVAYCRYYYTSRQVGFDFFSHLLIVAVIIQITLGPWTPRFTAYLTGGLDEHGEFIPIDFAAEATLYSSSWLSRLLIRFERSVFGVKLCLSSVGGLYARGVLCFQSGFL